MKTNYLFPHHFKKIGWFLFIPGVLLGLFYFIFDVEPNFLDLRLFALIGGNTLGGNPSYFTFVSSNALNEIIALLLIFGAIFIALSKEKNEDEFISKIRLESLVWATYINYAVLILANLFVFDLAFLWVLIFNMFTILIFFIIRFNWIIYKSRKTLADEK